MGTQFTATAAMIFRLSALVVLLVQSLYVDDASAQCTTTSFSTAVETVMVTLPTMGNSIAPSNSTGLAAPASSNPINQQQLAIPTVPTLQNNFSVPALSTLIRSSGAVAPSVSITSSMPSRPALTGNNAVTVTVTKTTCPHRSSSSGALPAPASSFIVTGWNSLKAPMSLKPSSPLTTPRPLLSIPVSSRSTLSSRPTPPLDVNTQTTTPQPTPSLTSKMPFQITGRTMIRSRRPMITTSLLRIVPHYSVITSHVMPVAQCVLITPSKETTVVSTVSTMVSKWMTTVMPEDQHLLLKHFAGHTSTFATAWSSAWTRHYVVRAGVTEEVFPTQA